jgi:hypothetical protein
MYSDPTGHNTLDDYEYQRNVEKRRNASSSTLDNYAYQNTTKKTSSRQSNSLDNYYYNQDMSDAHLLQQTREQQKAPQTITSTAKSTTNDSAMISFLLNPNTSAYLTSGQYKQTLAWVDQERINRGGSILISGLQLSTDPTSKGYNERDLAFYQAINKLTCFNGDIGNTDKLLGALENRYTALGIDSSNALTLDAQGMKNLSAVAAERNTAINGGTGFNLLKFQEENLYTSSIISTTVTAATYGGLMTIYAGSGPQKTSLTNSDIIDAQVATGNVEYAKTMNALTDEDWIALQNSRGTAKGAGELVDNRPYLDPNSRPSFRKGVVESTWNNAKGPDGLVRDPNTGDVINWSPGQSRKGIWDMGHVPGQKYYDMYQKYIQGEMTPKQFRDWYNNPNNYRPEIPRNNRGHLFE